MSAYRYEFGEPDDRGDRVVRAFLNDVCILDGVLIPARVVVTPARVGNYACFDLRTEQPPTGDELTSQQAHSQAAVDDLLAMYGEVTP